MKTKYTIIFVFLAIAVKAQNDSVFWSQKMKNVVEKGSSKDWIKIKSNQQYSKNEFFSKNSNEFGLSEDDEMLLVNSNTDKLGLSHFRYQRFYKGIKVEGAEYILHEENSELTSANGKIGKGLAINNVPSISEEDALSFALTDVSATKYGWEEELNGNLLYDYPTGELVITKKDSKSQADHFRLAYKFEIATLLPTFSKQAIYVDASSGKILKRTNLVYRCSQGATSTLYNGSQYIKTDENNFGYFKLLDECRGGGIHTYHNKLNVLDNTNNFVNTKRERVAGSAHWAAEMTYDYFLHSHGRNSYDNNGSKIYIFASQGFADNASWDGEYVRLGQAFVDANNDLVSLDVVAHELAHGVTGNSAGLEYRNESGALNESFSDIFGTMVEFYGSNGAGDYLIGEDFWIEDGKMRDMIDPNSKEHPDTYLGSFWDPNEAVHTNSSVQNHWFYLLSEGGAGTNDNGVEYIVSGIGRDKAAAIAYRNLTVYLTSTSGYSDAKNGAIWAATDLYGSCSNEVVQTIRAWDAVGVPSAGGMDFATIINCNGLNMAQNQGVDYFRRAITEMIVDCHITPSSNSTITLVAGQEISINPGFSVSSEFHSYIEACLGHIQSKNNDVEDSYIYSPISLEQEKEEADLFDKGTINVFPNPSGGLIKIQLVGGRSEIRIYDQLGRLAFNEIYFNDLADIDLSHLNSGQYHIVVINNNGASNGKIVLAK